MDWDHDLADWPLNALSRRVKCKPHHWHIQEAGEGQTVLLIHGAGASTHTWRDLLPMLAKRYHTVALDLPGQGFTRLGSRGRCSLPLMSQDIMALCASENWYPKAIIGHSAGAAIALTMAHRLDDPPAVIGLNAALGRFDGMASWLFPLLAKLLALNPFTAHAFTMGRGHQARARRLIEGTGSVLSDDALALYARLFADRAHVDGTLQMMSQWNTDALSAHLSEITAPCLLLAAENDKAVAPSVSQNAADQLAHARYQLLTNVGHVAHEEDPDRIGQIILSWLQKL